jgi:DNA-binding transcriptional LysR family regulator
MHAVTFRQRCSRLGSRALSTLPPENRHTGSSSSRPGRSASGPAIELRHLRYFVAVSEELHFRRAAERLHIAQPPLSQAIRKLEDELGVSLLRRTSRVVTLTDAGRTFAEQARSVLAGLDLAVAEARRAGGAGSTLRIGCAPQLPIQLLLRFLGALHEREATSSTQVVNLLAREQIRRLLDGDLELGIFSYVEDFEGIELEPLFAGEPLAAFLRPDHPLARRDVVRPADVHDQQGVIFPRPAGPALHDWLLTAFAESGYRFASTREAGGVESRDLLLAVASGLGIAFLPGSLDDVGQAATQIVKHIRLDPPLRMPETVMAWRASPPRQLESRLATAQAIARELRSTDAALEPGLDRDDADTAGPSQGIGRP